MAPGTLAEVAKDRELAQRLIDEASGSYAKRTRVMIVSPVNEAFKAQRITTHNLRGLDVEEDNDRAELIPVDREQLEIMAGKLDVRGLGLLIWLGWFAGLRIGESLGVNIGDFIDDEDGEKVLRLTRQRMANGTLAPMKARRVKDYRDIPVSPALWSKIQEATPDADGYLFPKQWRTSVMDQFRKARDAAGLPPAFVPHQLRHHYASNNLADGVPITDLKVYMGHKSILITDRVYGHLVSKAHTRARKVFAGWTW